MTTQSVRRPRTPGPWWFRLGAWLLALGILLVTFLFVISRSSYGTTEHTWRSQPLTVDNAQLPPTLEQTSTFVAGSQLAGPVVLEPTGDGVDAYPIEGGDTVWSYHRPGKQVCASHASPQRLIMMYANGDVCNEALSLDLGTGKRVWSRTLEAVAANEIVWEDSTFLSVDEQKVILYEQTQGYERFTFTAVDTRSSGAEESECEQLDAAGTTLIGTLQRCRVSADAPWTTQVVVNSVDDGKPLEMGRTPLDLPEPQLLGTLPDGTSLIRSETTLYVAPLGATTPIAVGGLALDEHASAQVTGAGALLTTGGRAYSLVAPYTTIGWSRELVSTPVLRGAIVNLATASGVETIDLRGGQTATISALPASLPASDRLPTLTVSGAYAALSGSDETVVYA